MLVKYMSSVCASMIKSILSVICHAIHGALCIQLTRLFYDDCEDMCNSTHCHDQIGSVTISHCLGLDHETKVCAVCLIILWWVPMIWPCKEPAYQQWYCWPLLPLTFVVIGLDNGVSSVWCQTYVLTYWAQMLMKHCEAWKHMGLGNDEIWKYQILKNWLTTVKHENT